MNPVRSTLVGATALLATGIAGLAVSSEAAAATPACSARISASQLHANLAQAVALAQQQNTSLSDTHPAGRASA